MVAQQNIEALVILVWINWKFLQMVAWSGLKDMLVSENSTVVRDYNEAVFDHGGWGERRVHEDVVGDSDVVNLVLEDIVEPHCSTSLNLMQNNVCKLLLKELSEVRHNQVDRLNELSFTFELSVKILDIHFRFQHSKLNHSILVEWLQLALNVEVLKCKMSLALILYPPRLWRYLEIHIELSYFTIQNNADVILLAHLNRSFICFKFHFQNFLIGRA
mgnify:CR=1 FL=1